MENKTKYLRDKQASTATKTPKEVCAAETLLWISPNKIELKFHY